MKALINNHNMFGNEFNDEQVKMIYDNQKRALLEGFEHDHLFEDQRVTVVEYGRTAIRFGLMRGNQRVYRHASIQISGCYECSRLWLRRDGIYSSLCNRR